VFLVRAAKRVVAFETAIQASVPCAARRLAAPRRDRHTATNTRRACVAVHAHVLRTRIPVAQELGRSPFPVVRNNIMVGLSDMLIQYTALVDAHMPRLAACIR
jgi:hypothetical protein